MKPEDIKINLNQNLWLLIVSLLTLGFSEFYKLYCLFYFGIILSLISTISSVVTLFYYTKKYIKNKNK